MLPAAGAIAASVVGEPTIDVRAGATALRVDGLLVQSTPDAIAEARLTRLAGTGAALTWNQTDARGVTQQYYAFTRGITPPAAAPEWSRPIENGGGGGGGGGGGENAILELRWERFDPLAPGVRRFPVPAPLAANADHRAFIVQFAVPPFDVLRSQVERLGGVIYASLPAAALIVDLDPKSIDAVRTLPGVRWVGSFEPAYKSDANILRGYLPKFGGNDAGARAEFQANWGKPYVQAMESFAEGKPASFWIQVHRSGIPMKNIVAHAIGQLGGVVQDLTPDDNLLRALLTQQQLIGVLALTEVAFVDPWSPAETDMDIVRQISGANALEAATGFTGQGVRGETIDTGVRVTHQAFSAPGPAPIVRTNSTDTSHGTSTFGIIFGDGSGNPAGRGLLPDAAAKYVNTYTSLSGFGGTASRLTVTAASVDQNNVVFQSNSWGSGLTTVYTTLSQGMDQIIFQTGLLICQSQSNNSDRNSRPEAWAKNVLAVGAFNHQNTLSRADDAVGGGSIGPAADGRIKPELAHFYDSVLTTTDTSDTAYTPTFGGTSAATPIICGHMGLIFQMWHEGIFPGFGHRASVFESRPYQTTARALAIHSAYRYTWTAGGPNASINRNVQGWGCIDLARLLTLAPTMYVENEAKNLLAGQSASYTFDVTAGSPLLALTMAYADPPGTVSATQHRINDLSLRVTAPDGTIWWGNNGLAASNNSTPGGTSNTKDTLENIFVPAPAAGRYRVDVFADVIAQDSNPRTPGVIDASFSLVVSGAARTPLRVLTLDGARTGSCTLGGTALSLADSPAFSGERTWLADPSLFGGAGKVDRPVAVLPPVNTLTTSSLGGADVVVLTGLASGLSACERNLLAQFVRQGGGVLAMYDNAGADLASIFGASPGGSGTSQSFDPVPAAAVLAGPYGAVASPITGGPCRVFDAIGPNGVPMLLSGSQPVAGAFTLDLGHAVLINDAVWAESAGFAGCTPPPAASAAAQSLFLNSLAAVAPRNPINFNFGCCYAADYNGSGALEVQDVFDFLDAWLAGDPRADFNGSGLSQQDVFDFIVAWFSGY